MRRSKLIEQLWLRVKAAEDALAAIEFEHRQQVIQTVAVLESTGLPYQYDDPGGGWREIDPDSFEGIVSRDQQDMACWPGTKQPCPTLQAVEKYRAEWATR